MIKKVKKKHTKKYVLGFLDPIIAEWFNNNFADLTPAQAHAIPLIRKGKNVLVASPTGSGKTLSAFLMILNELFDLGKHAKLENKVYCIYISPLKALANDIERNLNEPLKQICALARQYGITLPEIRVNVRSGDTSTAERVKMAKKPPHILITTPESLSLMLSTKVFRYKLLNTGFVIVDEIHDICNSKRGVQLSLNLERLQYQIFEEGSGREFIRIGLSATQAPIREIAKFLSGYTKDHQLREMNIVEVIAGKKLDLKVICPVLDMNSTPYEIVKEKMYDILQKQIESHRSTLVFTNTRRGAETMAYKLHEKGVTNVAAHHGSLSKETRFEVEEQLKNGELDATICSTSLELGIDIGYIDLVCQIGSPKSIAKGLQRIGRAGHALHEISKGRIIIFDRDDLVECAVLVKNAIDGNIDRITILKNSLDVLAQALIGMSLEKGWHTDEAYSLVKQTYCYHKLPKKAFNNVLNYISGKHTMNNRGVYGKVRYYPEDHVFGIRGGVRSIYNLNIGTIPQEASYRVVVLSTGSTVGVLSERFVEHLTKKDVFVLGGKTYEFIQASGMKVYVGNAHGRKPTIPSWTGEMLARSFDLSCEVGRFRGMLGQRLEHTGLIHENADSETNKPGPGNSKVIYKESKLEALEQWLRDEYHLDSGSARSILNYFIEQQSVIKYLPTDKSVLIEGYIDGRGFKNVIFHYCYGRRVNDALARAYAYTLSKKLRCTVRVSLTDNNFMLTFRKDVALSGIERIVTKDTLQQNLKAALRNTELFKQRFRHCAVRSFMILRNYKGRDISVRKQMKRSQYMLDMLQEQDSFPVINEAYNEILHSMMDIEHAQDILKKINNGEIAVNYSNYSKIPSPFAHNVILTGVSDIILMEDRSALLRELHQQVLGRVLIRLDLTKPKFQLDMVNKHFKDKFPQVSKKEDPHSKLKQYLKYYAPAPVTAICYDLGLKEEEVSSHLAALVKAGDISSGGYIPGKDVPQYILNEDLSILEQMHEAERKKIKIFNERQVQEYLVNKMFEPVRDIKAYFDKFGIAFDPREVFIRTRKFSMDKWNDSLNSHTDGIVYGRFLNGRVCYIPMVEVPVYVSAYRTAHLTNLELTVLNLIKKNRGISRLELSKMLDAREMDLKEIIDKLEHNLFILREPPTYDSQASTANRYVFYDLQERIENCEQKIISRLLKGHSPMTLYDIRNYTGFSKELIEQCLGSLIECGEIVKFHTQNENSIETYLPCSELNRLKRYSYSEKLSTGIYSDRVILLSLFDSYSVRLLTLFRIKFGDGWLTPVVYFGKLIGSVSLWRLASCIEMREIEFDPELITDAIKFLQNKLHLLELTLAELDKLMGYYNMHGLDVIRIRKIFGFNADALPDDVAAVLARAGYKKVQDFYVKGKLETNVFDLENIMKLMLQNQHILPGYKFTNPLAAFKTLGQIRSSFELRLRLEGKFHDVKELRKILDLSAGPVIPDYYSYCTDKDLRIYKIAKGRQLDLNMQYILENMPDEYSISVKNLFARISLTPEQFNSARKRLYEGLFIIRDSMNKYTKVKKYRNLTKQYARKYLLKRIIRNFGIFSAENLAVFTRHEYSMKELRGLLRELESEGVLVKGYFIEDDDTLYWVNKDSFEELLSSEPDLEFTERFVVSPQDQFTAYLAPMIRKRFGFGSCFVIFQGFKISGVFKLKQKDDKKVMVTDFVGDDDDWRTIETFLRMNGLELTDEESEDLYSEV